MSDLVLSLWGSACVWQAQDLAVLTLTACEQRDNSIWVRPSPEHLKEIHIFHPASGGTGHRPHQGLHPVAGGRSEPTGISRCPQGLWCLCWAGVVRSPPRATSLRVSAMPPVSPDAGSLGTEVSTLRCASTWCTHPESTCGHQCNNHCPVGLK